LDVAYLSSEGVPSSIIIIIVIVITPKHLQDEDEPLTVPSWPQI
jgi:hypothetical protein